MNKAFNMNDDDDMMGEVSEELLKKSETTENLIESSDRAKLEAKLIEIEERTLKERLDLAEKLKQAQEELLHARADMDNLRKQGERRVLEATKYSVSKLLVDLVPVRDSLEQGLKVNVQSASVEAMREGMALISQNLLKVLEKFGVKIIYPEINRELFNPALHEVMLAQVKADIVPNTVIEVMQEGYQLHDRLIRPARVIVAKAPIEET